MTVGNPIGHILRFALPLLVGNIFQQFYNMVDSLVVGNFVGANALAAVGNCGAVNSLFFALANGLSIGIGILAAQYFGAHDEGKIKSVIANAVYALGSVAIVMSVFGILFSPQVIWLMGTPEGIRAESVIYMRVTCAGMLGLAFYNGAAAVLRALGDARTPLYFLILSSIVNVILDLLFVLQLDMGVMGVGLATMIAEYTSAIVCLLYAYKRVSFFRLRREDMKPDREIIIRSFQLGIPIAMQSAMISVSRMILQGVINSFGESVMAASNIINRIEELVQQPFSSLHAALTTYAGQNIGARDTERVKKGYRQSAVVAVSFGLLIIPIAYLFGENIIGAFVKEEEVIAIGTAALHINSLFYTVVGMIHVSRAVLNGCGDTGFALMNGVTEVICRVCYSQFFTRIPAIGYWGIWVTTAATWTTTAVVCIIRYMTGKWKEKGA
ncbi:MAG: MATE family efflux transporter [Acetatifactor sp.]|nr:MATE family efflux transporter [Acetatifactor sp.]